jgi:hypothetical protein
VHTVEAKGWENMVGSAWRRGGLAVTAAALAVGVAGCHGGGTGKGASAAAHASKAPAATSPLDAVDAAYKKLTGVRSAKFTMTMTTPQVAAGAGTTSIKTSGVIGWDPLAMQMSMDASALGAGSPDVPSTIKVELVGTTMYMDLGAEAAKETGGKRWMKIDYAQAAKQPGGANAGVLGSELQSSNQNPSAQLGLLLGSPHITRVGSQTVDGVATEHYRGAFTPEQALQSNPSVHLTPAQRKTYTDSLKQAGITSEDLDVWVGKDDYPVRMDATMNSSQGRIGMSLHYSDYSTKAAAVQAPPAADTFDLQDLAQQTGAGTTAG